MSEAVSGNMEELEEIDDSHKNMYMSFMAGKESYAITIDCVNEIVGFQNIVRVPDEEVDYIKGLINLRGKVIPVIDACLRFKRKPAEYTERTCIIVIEAKSVTVGLIVEKIADVVIIPKETIIDTPRLVHSTDKSDRYIFGIGKVGNELKLLVDPDKLIDDEDINVFEDMMEEKDS